MLLQTFGCSFTYGEELPDPSTQAWPVLVSEKLGYKIQNYGKGGVGNNYLIKKAMTKTTEHNPDLVIVAWTSCSRQEFTDEWGTYDIAPGWFRRFEKYKKHRLELAKYLTAYYDEQYQYRQWLRSVILLQDFFKLRNINYRFVSAFDNQALNAKYRHTSNEYINLIDTDKFIGWPFENMVEWTHKEKDSLPRGPGGHPLEEGHKRIADIIFDAL
jgi:hypothetical protein